MLNKIKILVFLLVVSELSAHNLWLSSNESSKLEASIGYGHNFPKLEKIDKDRLSIFDGIKISGNDFSQKMKNKGENHNFVYNKELHKGTYVASSIYKTTYWTKDDQNDWFMNKKKNEIKTKAVRCIVGKMEAKTVFNIGDSVDEFSTLPIGHTLEIIPLDNPKDIKVGKPFTVQVLFKGKALKNSPVKATFDGFLKNKSAFYGNTDLKGKTQIVALKDGFWNISVKVKRDYKNKEECDEDSYSASLTLNINK